MRRRTPESADVAAPPPPELERYTLWCTNRGRRAFGQADDAASMTEAAESFQAWSAERRAWTATHGTVLEWVDRDLGAPIDWSLV